MGDVKIVGEEKTLRICVVSFPMPSKLVVNVFLYSLVEILEQICERVYVVTSNIPKDRIFSKKIRIQDVKTAMHFRDTIHPMWWSTLLQFFKVIFIQIKMCWALTKISKEIDAVIFYTGGANLFPPLLMAKVLGKKAITLVTGLGSLSYKESHTKRLFSIAYSTILNVLERANFYLSDMLIVYTESAVGFLNLGRYKQKLVTTGARYIDTELFQIKKRAEEKEKFGWIHWSIRRGEGCNELC